MWQSNSLFVLNTKHYVLGKPSTTHYLVSRCHALICFTCSCDCLHPLQVSLFSPVYLSLCFLSLWASSSCLPRPWFCLPFGTFWTLNWFWSFCLSTTILLPYPFGLINIARLQPSASCVCIWISPCVMILSIFPSIVVATSCYGYACNNFSGYKIHGMELSTGQILEENLVQSDFHQTLGD